MVSCPRVSLWFLFFILVFKNFILIFLSFTAKDNSFLSTLIIFLKNTKFYFLVYQSSKVSASSSYYNYFIPNWAFSWWHIFNLKKLNLKNKKNWKIFLIWKNSYKKINRPHPKLVFSCPCLPPSCCLIFFKNLL